MSWSFSRRLTCLCLSFQGFTIFGVHRKVCGCSFKELPAASLFYSFAKVYRCKDRQTWGSNSSLQLLVFLQSSSWINTIDRNRHRSGFPSNVARVKVVIETFSTWPSLKNALSTFLVRKELPRVHRDAGATACLRSYYHSFCS